MPERKHSFFAGGVPLVQSSHTSHKLWFSNLSHFPSHPVETSKQQTASCLPGYADQPINGLLTPLKSMSRCICNQNCFSNICTKWSRHWQRASFWCLLWSFWSDLWPMIRNQLMTSDIFKPETFQGFESGKTQSWQSLFKSRQGYLWLNLYSSLHYSAKLGLYF